MKQLNEYKISDHWAIRRNERIDGMEIIYPSAMFSETDDKETIKKVLDEKIRFGIRTRVVAYQMLHDTESQQTNVTVFAQVQLKKDGKIFTPIIKSTADGKTYAGNVFIGITKNDTLITLLNIPMNVADPVSLAKKAAAHLGNTPPEEISVKTLDKALMTLDVDFLVKAKESADNAPKKEFSQENLPYKVKKDYIKSSPGRPNFITHDVFGRGEIKSSEQGMNGKWNNVMVQFPTPVGLKRFPTIYADAFFMKATPA